MIATKLSGLSLTTPCHQLIHMAIQKYLVWLRIYCHPFSFHDSFFLVIYNYIAIENNQVIHLHNVLKAGARKNPPKPVRRDEQKHPKVTIFSQKMHYESLKASPSRVVRSRELILINFLVRSQKNTQAENECIPTTFSSDEKKLCLSKSRYFLPAPRIVKIR